MYAGSLDRIALYDAIYTLAAGKGREAALFGSCTPLAHEAFCRSLTAGGFPTIWFETPLMGEPRFDLHVAFSHKVLGSDARFLHGGGNGYDELLRWFAKEGLRRAGLAFAYDISEGRIDDPAVHINISAADVHLIHMDRFFGLVADEGAARRYDGFVGRLPRGWNVWYAGVHPGRPGAPVRVDCFVGKALKEAYAADASLLERDLRACGFAAMGPALRDLAAPILESPFSLELQFDVTQDGTPGPTIGLSAGFSLRAQRSARALFDKGNAAATLMEKVEHLGLADARWHHLPGATFSMLVPVDDMTLALYIIPTFVKLRMRDGEPLDAKAYLQAGAEVLTATRPQGTHGEVLPMGA